MENRVTEAIGNETIESEWSMRIQIGSLRLSGAVLAPMAGVTDMPFRLLCKEMGSALSATEMVSAKGLLCAPPNSRAIQSLLSFAPQEGPVAVQLFGHDPQVIANAIEKLEGHGFHAVDLNMGCPAPKITGGGDGSALLRDLALAARVIRAARRATPLPLTVKMRIGWDDTCVVAVPFARMAEAEGADALTVHGRTRAQFYAGDAKWEEIAKVKAAVSIPVIGNGDITSAGDALRRMRETGCDGVAIGRGALGNPWIFAQIRAALHGGEYTPPTDDARIAVALRHARMLCAWKGEAVAIREMRKQAAWYTRGMAGSAKLRTRIHGACTLRELQAVLEG